VGATARAIGATALAACAILPAPASAQQMGAEPAQVVVRFEVDASAEDRADARDAVDAELERGLELPRTQLLELEPGAPLDEAAADLEREPGVRWAEPNLRRSSGATVNDPYFGYLWGLRNAGQLVQGRGGTPGVDVRATLAWDIATGGGGPVAVVDSGVDARHPDLAPRIWANPAEIAGNGADDDRNGYVDDTRGWDWVGEDPDPQDENGHGTHVAGTIAGTGNDHVGVVGVAPTASVLPLRVLGADGNGSVADLVDAYAYAAQKGVRVVNLSLSGSSFSRAERDALAAAPGVLFVAAAGNGGSDGVGDDNDAGGAYPCAYDLPNVLCVAAIDRDGGLAAFSNYGRGSVDLAAPGVGVLSDLPVRSGEAQYGYASGTSMATPHVAGAAALLAGATAAPSPGALRRALLESVESTPSLAGRVATGGRLNARAALERSGLSEPPAAQAPAAGAPPTGPSSAVPTPGVPPPTAVPGTRPPGPVLRDNDPPLVSLLAPPRGSVRAFRARGLRAGAGCSEPCRLTAALTRRGRVLGRASGALARAGRVVLRLRPTRAGRRAHGATRARLTVRVRDAADNARTVSASVVLRR
jgi:subtilisin family serine protease